jgi:pimeloyl-ACP methyl ester carboxylesterase
VTDSSPDVHAPWPGENVRLGRQLLYVRRSTARVSATVAPSVAAPAVLLHGLGGSSLNWTDLMAALDDLDCFAPDLPGFGRSVPPDDGDYSLDGHVRQVVSLIEYLDAGPVHLMGNSLGGAVATRIAATRPDLVASLVLISPALPERRLRRTTVGVPLLAAPGIGPWFWRRVARADPARRVTAMLELTFGDPAVVPEARRAEAAEEYRRRYALPYAADALVRSTRGLVAAYSDLGPRGLWRQARQVKVPTLLIYGTRDRLVDSRGSAKAARTFPDARLVVLPGAGHVSQMERPDVVAGLVREFLPS